MKGIQKELNLSFQHFLSAVGRSSWFLSGVCYIVSKAAGFDENVTVRRPHKHHALVGATSICQRRCLPHRRQMVLCELYTAALRWSQEVYDFPSLAPHDDEEPLFFRDTCDACE